MLNLEITCPFCGHISYVTVNEDDYASWQSGILAQLAFPYLDADERELLISGVCSDCWERMFSNSDDEEEEDWEDPAWHDTCDEDDDYWLEDGFNPYMGCYDYDC